jgi:autoinducer 2-degrading protein
VRSLRGADVCARLRALCAQVKEERHADELLELMTQVAAASCREPGCLRYDVLRDRSNPKAFLFYEVYASEEDFAHHKALPHTGRWRTFKFRDLPPPNAPADWKPQNDPLDNPMAAAGADKRYAQLLVCDMHGDEFTWCTVTSIQVAGAHNKESPLLTCKQLTDDAEEVWKAAVAKAKEASSSNVHEMFTQKVEWPAAQACHAEVEECFTRHKDAAAILLHRRAEGRRSVDDILREMPKRRGMHGMHGMGGMGAYQDVTYMLEAMDTLLVEVCTVRVQCAFREFIRSYRRCAHHPPHRRPHHPHHPPHRRPHSERGNRAPHAPATACHRSRCALRLLLAQTHRSSSTCPTAARRRTARCASLRAASSRPPSSASTISPIQSNWRACSSTIGSSRRPPTATAYTARPKCSSR